jgi:hypothetical protein
MVLKSLPYLPQSPSPRLPAGQQTIPNGLVAPPRFKHASTHQASHTPWCSSAATPNPHIHLLTTHSETADPNTGAEYRLTATPNFPISRPHSMRAAPPPTSQVATQETDPMPTTAIGRTPIRRTASHNGRLTLALLPMPLKQIRADTQMFGSIGPKEGESPLPTTEATTHRPLDKLSMLSLGLVRFGNQRVRTTSGTEWCSPLTQQSR